MNFYGLYQAVRSRLHFSQVAAWWSRSNGTDPSYIVTRMVPYNEDNLRKFRETPVEHTFPLAGNSDGNSIKVNQINKLSFQIPSGYLKSRNIVIYWDLMEFFPFIFVSKTIVYHKFVEKKIRKEKKKKSIHIS